MGGEEMGGDERGEERMLCYFRLCYVMARSSDLVKEGLVVEGVPAHLRGEAGGERRSETDEIGWDGVGMGPKEGKEVAIRTPSDGLEWMFGGQQRTGTRDSSAASSTRSRWSSEPMSSDPHAPSICAHIANQTSRWAWIELS
jgi:hypothetical protein